MARPFALGPEVLDSFHQADTEELGPETIHHHAGGERVLGLQEPTRQAEAVLRGVGGPRGDQLFGDAGVDLLTEGVV